MSTTLEHLRALIRGTNAKIATTDESNATVTDKSRSRRKKRGMSPLSLTLETGAVMSWFVFMMLGEKLVGDATSARRSVTNTTQQSARVAGGTTGCSGGGQSSTSGPFTASPNMSIGQNGTPSIGQFMSIIEMLGFGSQSTMKLFSQNFQSSSVSSNVDNVKAATLLGGDSYSFTSQAQASCREQALDKPGTSITDYRNSVFQTNIQGWSGSQ